jgi:hypothetical protein
MIFSVLNFGVVVSAFLRDKRSLRVPPPLSARSLLYSQEFCFPSASTEYAPRVFVFDESKAHTFTNEKINLIWKTSGESRFADFL